MNTDKARFFRYIRPTNSFSCRFGEELVTINSTANLGGTTLAVELDYVDRTVKVGVAVCSPKENFSKELGRKISTERLEADPFTFNLDAFYEPGTGTRYRFIDLINCWPGTPDDPIMSKVMQQINDLPGV